MPLILHIDTATENATISIAQNHQLLHSLSSSNKKEHASFLQPGIKRLLTECKISVNMLKAISVTAGPGSYTGLRVGMASAKGMCYALRIPMITLSTLEVMAFSVILNTKESKSYLYCPMIEAGRMEVFTALFDQNLNILIPPCARVLQAGSFDDFIRDRQIIFYGSGAQKFITLSNQPDLIYLNTVSPAYALALLSLKNYQQSNFADLVNAEPVYLKQVYIISKAGKA